MHFKKCCSVVSSCCVEVPKSSLTGGLHIPNRQDTTGLSETSLLLDTADSLLEDGRDLSGRGLGVGSVGSDGVDGSRCGISSLHWARKKNMLAEFDQWKKTPWRTPAGSKKLKKARSAMLASRLHVQLSLRGRNSQVCRSMLGASKIFSCPPKKRWFPGVRERHSPQRLGQRRRRQQRERTGEGRFGTS